MYYGIQGSTPGGNVLCSSLLLNLIDFFVFGESHVCLFVCVCVVPNDQESMTHFVISICSLLPCGGAFKVNQNCFLNRQC